MEDPTEAARADGSSRVEGGPTLFVMVGLPASGKTRARELAESQHAIRLTPDEWMIPLFGEPEADGSATFSKEGS